MTVENVTTNRGWQLPHQDNSQRDDVLRIIAALVAADVDMQAAIAAAAGKAGLASPAFSGTPTAPTAAPGTDTNQLSTTAFVQAAISALVGGAPGALDTLNELAAALADDASFAATVATSLALKAPLDSPAMTGTPTAPTRSVGDSSTGLATTEFVTAAVQKGSNANGEYVRFPDGTQICWNRAVESVACETANGTIFSSAATTTWTYPAAFISTPLGVARSYGASSRWATVSTESNTSAGLRVFSTITSAALLPVGGIAIGRWK